MAIKSSSPTEANTQVEKQVDNLGGIGGFYTRACSIQNRRLSLKNKIVKILVNQDFEYKKWHRNYLKINELFCPLRATSIKLEIIVNQ